MKVLRTAVLLILVSLVFPILSEAQSWKQYQWKFHNIKFELPDTYTVSSNSEEALKASSEGVEFALFPIKTSEMNDGDLAGFLVRIAEAELNLTEIDEMQLVEVDGMSGGFISGSTDDQLFMILGLKDPESKKNFYAYVSYTKEQEEVIENALEIFRTFGKMQ